MSFVFVLESIFIGPLKLVFEIIYSLALSLLKNPGLSIIALSLSMNFLVLPLYRRADAMQEQARDTENKLSRGVNHIKKTFSGDERMMILQTYYRQNHYKPTDALRGSVSLLLEIPFFMAAYQFLSGMTVLKGVPFGPISDLASPDGLISIAGITVNVLPVLMTAINVVSSAIYLKGFPLKTKIQLYGMAAFFLVFLYNSPACLVFYWTLNNLFSLVKTICYKLKNPRKVLKITLAICTLGISLLLGKALSLLRAKKGQMEAVKPDKKVFLLSCTVLAILTGLMIPSSVIGASPQEFVDIFSFHNPLNYLLAAGALGVGTFLVWVPVFYWLASDKGKAVLSRLMAIAAVTAMVNFTFFGWNLGLISTNLQYSKGFIYSNLEKIINLAVFVVLVVGLWLLATRKKKIMASVLAIIIMGSVGMSVWNGVKIIQGTNQVKAYMQKMEGKEAPNFRLSREGKNVVVIMLDRALGYFMPYYLAEKPELAQRLDGFTHYINTISFGGHTNFGVPSLFGGYEYTPVELNKRENESLQVKNDEALKVLPVLFSQNGYEVTVCDPPYAGYSWIPDLSIFEEYPEIDTFITKGYYKSDAQRQVEISSGYRNFFVFGLMRSLPVAIQRGLYEGGHYHQEYNANGDTTYYNQAIDGLHKASGTSGRFLGSFEVLQNLSNMTQITSDKVNTYLSMDNESAHSPVLLQMPGYTPSQVVDNPVRKTVTDGKGNTLTFENEIQMGQYHTGMATMLCLADWFDYMRQNGVYDNTKIILVADHGYNIGQLPQLKMPMGNGETEDCSYYYPLLMVKDFGATGYETSQDFMTNADVPTLATQATIENPVNPFTGKPINNAEKTAHPQFILVSRQWSADVNNGNTYIADKWASVHTDMRDPQNWDFYTGSTVLKEHKLPQ